MPETEWKILCLLYPVWKEINELNWIEKFHVLLGDVNGEEDLSPCGKIIAT